MRFVRDLIETYIEPSDAVVFLQTIEHVKEPEQVLAHFKAMAPVAYVSTPNLLTLAPPGRRQVGQPLASARVPRARVPRAVRDASTTTSSCTASSTPASSRSTSSRCARAGTACTPGSGITKPFYDRFTPAISARDFALREGPLDRALDFVAVLR